MKKESARGRDCMDSWISEDFLLARKARKDNEARRRVIERLMPKVKNMVYQLEGSGPDAKDLVNSCLAEILDSLPRYKGKGSLKSWAGKIAYRVIMRQLKRKRQYERTISLTSEEKGASSSNPADESLRRAILERLYRHMKKIPEERREVLVLRLVYEYSVAEVASITGAPVNTVRNRIRLGLKQLRRSLFDDTRAVELILEETNGKR